MGMFYTQLAIVKYNYFGDKWLDPEICQEKYNHHHLTPVAQAQRRLPEWLRHFSLITPIFGLIAFILIGVHVVHFTKQAYVLNQKSSDERLSKYPNQHTRRQDMVLLVIAMPAVFLIMSLRSTSRMWMIVSGHGTGAESNLDM